MLSQKLNLGFISGEGVEVVLIKKKLKKNLMEKAFKTNFASAFTFLWIPEESEVHHDNK